MSEQPITHCEHGIDRAYRCIDCIEAECDALRARVQELEIERDQLAAALEAARVDAARYRWLRKGESDDVAVVRGLGATDYGMSAVVYTYSEDIDGDDLDATIDAAMRKEGRGDE